MSTTVARSRGPISSAAARHPWRTIGAWLAAIVVSVLLIVFFLGDALTGEAEQLNNPESEQAYDLMDERLSFVPYEFSTDVVLIRSGSLTSDDPRFQAKVDEVIGRLRETPGVVNVIDKPAAKTQRAVIIEVGLEDEGAAEPVTEVLRSEDDGTFDLYATGEWMVENDFQKLSQDDLKKGELQFGLPAALLILLLVFGAVVAGLVPIALALVAIVTALGLVGLVGTAFELSIFTVNMLTGMGLALGIDYSLFVVSRFREERAGGREKLDAIATTGLTASRAVFFSGLAFVVAMLGLLLIPNTIFRSLAFGAITVGITSVVAALTLLPAVLSLLGDRVNALRIPIIGRGSELGTAREGRFWGAIVRAVMRRLSVCRCFSSIPARQASARCPTATPPSRDSTRCRRRSASGRRTRSRSSSTDRCRPRPARRSRGLPGRCGGIRRSGRSRSSSIPRATSQ
jgi:RND superfamily putative drug exporter